MAVGLMFETGNHGKGCRVDASAWARSQLTNQSGSQAPTGRSYRHGASGDN